MRNAFGSTHADVSLKALEEYGTWVHVNVLLLVSICVL